MSLAKLDALAYAAQVVERTQAPKDLNLSDAHRLAQVTLRIARAYEKYLSGEAAEEE